MTIAGFWMLASIIFALLGANVYLAVLLARQRRRQRRLEAGDSAPPAPGS